jgi:hypothetical protein
LIRILVALLAYKGWLKGGIAFFQLNEVDFYTPLTGVFQFDTNFSD